MPAGSAGPGLDHRDSTSSSNSASGDSVVLDQSSNRPQQHVDIFLLGLDNCIFRLWSSCEVCKGLYTFTCTSSSQL